MVDRDGYFWQRVAARWGDMDALGHVNNAKYFTYFETVRMSYLRQIGLWKEGRNEQGPILVAESMNFRRQLVADQTIEVGVRISEARNRSFVMQVIMLDDTQKTAAEGDCVMAWMDFTTQKAIPIPEKVREIAVQTAQTKVYQCESSGNGYLAFLCQQAGND
ncbi:MAG TPA: thioesterase family protein [Acidobacteriota bacterium]|jgi:acyl-CoA thioester hydrolase